MMSKTVNGTHTHIYKKKHFVHPVKTSAFIIVSQKVESIRTVAFTFYGCSSALLTRNENFARGIFNQFVLICFIIDQQYRKMKESEVIIAKYYRGFRVSEA